MPSHINELENEGIIIIGRPVETEFDTPEPIEALAQTIDELAAKHSLPLGLVYCGTTVNWPDEVELTPIVIGLVTFSGFGDDDEPLAGTVGPEHMDAARAEEIPETFWAALSDKHGVEFGGGADVLLAVGGWTWANLEKDDEHVFGVSSEDDGYLAIPEELRSQTFDMKVGYC